MLVSRPIFNMSCFYNPNNSAFVCLTMFSLLIYVPAEHALNIQRMDDATPLFSE